MVKVLFVAIFCVIINLLFKNTAFFIDCVMKKIQKYFFLKNQTTMISKRCSKGCSFSTKVGINASPFSK
jgi:hypothetical protein